MRKELLRWRRVPQFLFSIKCDLSYERELYELNRLLKVLCLPPTESLNCNLKFLAYGIKP